MSKESRQDNQASLETSQGELNALIFTSKTDYEQLPYRRKTAIDTYLSRAVEHVPFYSMQKDKYTSIDCGNFYKLPLVFQDDLLKDPYLFVPKGSRPVQLTSSGGTYGKRKILFRTTEDMKKSAVTAASMFSFTGVNEGDIVAIMQPFDLWNIGHIGMQAFKRIGALSVPLGLSTKEDEILDILAFTKATVLYGTPSKVISLVTTSESKGLLSDLKISKVLCAGEPILEDHRQLIKKLWGAEIFGIYGSEETDGIGAECEVHNGYHVLDKNQLFEILDPETLLPAEKHEGVLAVTNVGYTGTILMRYLLGDRVQLDTDTCSCGEKSIRIRPRGRLEETIWLYAGTKVTVRSIEELMSNLIGRVPPYQIVVEQETHKDVLTIKINSESNIVLADKIIQEMRHVSQDMRECVDSGRVVVACELDPDPSIFESTIRGKVPKIIYKRKGDR